MSKQFNIEIFDVHSARLSELTMAMVMQISSATITIKELISNRVQAEVARYNNGEQFSALVQARRNDFG